MCRPAVARSRITAAAREPAVFPDLACGLTVMALNLLWIADLTYINLIRRHRPALTRDHTFAPPRSAPARSNFALPKSAGLKPPQPPHTLLTTTR